MVTNGDSDRYGHLFPELDKHAASKLDRVQSGALVDLDE